VKSVLTVLYRYSRPTFLASDKIRRPCLDVQYSREMVGSKIYMQNTAEALKAFNLRILIKLHR